MKLITAAEVEALTAVRLWQALPRAADCLAIELAFAAQAAAIRRELSTFPSKLVLNEEQASELRVGYKAARRAVRRHLGEVFEPRLQLKLERKIARTQSKLSPVCEQSLTVIARYFPTITSDTPLTPFLNELADAVRQGTLLEPARQAKIL